MSDLVLADARLKVRDDCFLKLDEHDNVISSIALAEIENVRCKRTFSFTALTAGLFFLWLMRFVYLSSEMFIFRWIAAPAAGLVGLFCLIGGLTGTEIEVKTKSGRLKFAGPADIRDGHAFAMTIMKLPR